MPMSVKPGLAFLLLLLTCFATQPVLAQKLVSQAAHLRNFPECFAVGVATDTTVAESIVADPPCFRLCWITNTQSCFRMFFFPDLFYRELRSCYFSQASIKGAVLMYNAEHTVPLRRISDHMVSNSDSPLMPDYLKHPFPRPTERCRYESAGDLLHGTLVIYCQFHGAPIKGPKSQTEEKSQP